MQIFIDLKKEVDKLIVDLPFECIMRELPESSFRKRVVVYKFKSRGFECDLQADTYSLHQGISRREYAECLVENFFRLYLRNK